jgi:UDP-MurNAc hydroxylase
MKLTYHNSAAVVIQDDQTKILVDPWLKNGEYFGSWGIFPPYDFKPQEFDDMDFIYISHIHPDHCSPKTLEKLNKKIPVLVHEFPEKYLKKNIQRLGFDVIELKNNVKTKLKNETEITIIAADNCNPEICGKLFGCGTMNVEEGLGNIDTMAIFNNQNETIVNTNDCPFEISEKTAKIVAKQYKKIDLLLVGYAGASSYPQCFNFSKEKLDTQIKMKKNKRLNDTLDYLKIFQPKYFFPFAGKYMLAGKNSILNKNRGEPDLDYALDYLIKNTDQNKTRCIALNSKESFDVTTGISTKKYQKEDLKFKEQYIKEKLSKIKFDFESEPEPKLSSLLKLLPDSYKKYNDIRKKLSYSTDTKIILKLNDDKFTVISCDGNGFENCTFEEIKNIKKFISIDVDKRLLYWLLQGPKLAQWNNVEIGSHLQFKRIPDIYERGLIHCLNYFYSGQYVK